MNAKRRGEMSDAAALSWIGGTVAAIVLFFCVLPRPVPPAPAADTSPPPAADVFDALPPARPALSDSPGAAVSPMLAGSEWPGSVQLPTLPPIPERVSGYRRADGRYVEPYWRSRADGDPRNNYSTYGNYNPFTGKPGTKHPGNGRSSR